MKNWQESFQDLISQENSLSLNNTSLPRVQNPYEFDFIPQNANFSAVPQNSYTKITITQTGNIKVPQNEEENDIINYNSNTTDSQSTTSSSQISQNSTSPSSYPPHNSTLPPSSYSPYLSPSVLVQPTQPTKGYPPLQLTIQTTEKYNYGATNLPPAPISAQSLISPIKTVTTANQYQPPYCTIQAPLIIQQNPSNSSKFNSFNYRIRWTKQEDEQLLNLVRRWGARRWNEIAASLGTKTAKQCRDHYANCLDPGIRNSLWTVEEEEVLLSKYNEIGPHWSRIRTFFPGRTNAMIKNYTIMLLKRNGKEMPPDIQTQKDKSESESSSNCSSGNEDNDDGLVDQNLKNDNKKIKKDKQKKNDKKQEMFSVNDINFLLNRPAKFPDSL